MPWTNKEHDEVVKKCAVVTEVTGTFFSDPAKQFIIDSLSSYSVVDVLKALDRCARECGHGHLSLADIVTRADEAKANREGAEKNQKIIDSQRENREQINKERQGGFVPPALPTDVEKS